MNKETLTYNTPNSEEIMRKIILYDFKRMQENADSKGTNHFFRIFSLIFSGLFILYLKVMLGYLLIGAGIMYLLFITNQFMTFKRQKKLYLLNLDEECNRLNENSKDVIWEFAHGHFSFKNYKAEYKFMWSEITYCILDDQYLYITASSPQMNFILDKANIDTEKLNKTIEYLELYSKFKEI